MRPLSRRIVAVLCALLLSSALIRVYRITDISMNYTLVEGDWVVVENLTGGIHVPSWFFYLDAHLYNREEGIERGDLLAFRHPLERRLYLKRCVALPGDRIFQRDKTLFLQIGGDSEKTRLFARKYGVELFFDEDGFWLVAPYSKFYTITHLKGVTGPPELIDYPKRRIPPHHYFLMGDFRDNSTDSRFFGPVSYDRIYYKVWLILKRSRGIERLGSIENL